ncbi:hypothetical protein K450DRAFT_267596 [Umbelopsis ramanniana AG]|uniref:DDB1- and CUL4-associated factor 12 beta-propeller domain-containing protein n=1 Tax=Umbelopsis ramanniana AG TaxID=1314678 RepID=A0AAD5EI27_UMBRA|nr:uncharacterized protein K450DRAFT_267596 [Umbelopsis ramanniana AG]KAI8584233.1 hypothetical protein K450DRAFT_267596 [Umbelopsis ramanniana AG]
MRPNELLWKREIGQKFSVTHWQGSTVTQVPMILKESPVNITGSDKVFSSYWLNDGDILFGTKDQKLPSPSPISITQKHNAIYLRGSQRTQNFCRGSNHLPKNSTVPLAGIRAINANPAGTLIAVASSNPYSIYILDLPSLSSNTILQGHTDAIFSVAWIDNETVISGSRDGTMKCWKVNGNKQQSVQDRSIEILEALWSTTEIDSQRIRDLIYLDMKAVTLSSNGFLDIWDVEKQAAQVNSICLPFPLEAVCMAGNNQNATVAVGSQAHVAVMDARSGSSVHTFQSVNDYTGVRSLDYCDYIITSGGGMGHIGWYDLRAQRYLKIDGQDFRSASAGWFAVENDLQSSSGGWHGNPTKAIYTLKYNHQRTKLFAAGGPLEANFKGAYAGVWM